MKKNIVFFIFSIISYSVFPQSSIKTLTYLDCFYAFIKGTNTSISDQILEDYIKDYHYDFYYKSRSNDIEWRTGTVKYREEINNGLSEHNSNLLYSARSLVFFNEYDFDRKGFPLDISERTFVQIFPTDDYNTYMTKIGLYFTNYSKYNFFPLNMDRASELIKSKTDMWNNVDRTVELQIFFRIAPFNTEEYNSISRAIGRGFYTVMGVIERIEVYDGTNKLADIIPNP